MSYTSFYSKKTWGKENQILNYLIWGLYNAKTIPGSLTFCLFYALCMQVSNLFQDYADEQTFWSTGYLIMK